MDNASKVSFDVPTLMWVNPSDCVDMDCDARRQLLIRDLDGSLTGQINGTIISKAEFEWDGDKRFGLGNIPFMMSAHFHISHIYLHVRTNLCMYL